MEQRIMIKRREGAPEVPERKVLARFRAGREAHPLVDPEPLGEGGELLNQTGGRAVGPHMAQREARPVQHHNVGEGRDRVLFGNRTALAVVNLDNLESSELTSDFRGPQ